MEWQAIITSLCTTLLAVGAALTAFIKVIAPRQKNNNPGNPDIKQELSDIKEALTDIKETLAFIRGKLS